MAHYWSFNYEQTATNFQMDSPFRYKKEINLIRFGQGSREPFNFKNIPEIIFKTIGGKYPENKTKPLVDTETKL